MMKKIVFCFSLLFGLNAIALTADVDSTVSAETDASMALDELFNDGQTLQQLQDAQPNSYLENQKIARDPNNEINAYEALANLIQEIKLARAYLVNIRSRLTVTLDAVYDQNSSIDERLESIEDARRLVTLYQEATDQLIDLVEQLPGLKETYIKVLLARREAIGTRNLPSLENEQHSLITEKRKIDSPYQKIQKQPKPQLNVQRIAALHTNFEALRQALSATNTPIDRINELGDIAFDNVQTTEQVFDYSQYDLSENRANKGLLMQIQTYYTAAAQLWGTISNTDPSSDEYIVLCDKLRGITGRMNRLIRKVANIPAPTRNLNVLISDIGEYISAFDELNKKLSKTGVRFNSVKGIGDYCFDDDLLKWIINSDMGNQSEQQGSTVHNDYLAAKEIWEAIISSQDKQKALLVNTRKLYNALAKFIPELVELVNQLRYDIAHPNR